MAWIERADLELVVTVADAGSLSAAARRLHIAQPALSRRLARLEHDLGAQLFVRGRHGAVATPAGRTLIERGRAAIAALDRAEQDTLDTAAGRAGRIRIGTTPTLGADALPPVLAELRRRCAGARLELVASGDSAWLRQAVRDGELDVAMAVIDPSDGDGLEVAVSAAQRFALAVPADHRFAAARSVPRHRLVGEPMVCVSHGQGLRAVVDAVLAELGSEPVVSIETSEREMLLPFVTAGLGVTLVPEVFALQRAGPGVMVRPLRPRVERTVGVIVRRGERAALIDAFVTAARTVAWSP